MIRPIQIRIIGAHSTGKSTLMAWISERYGIRALPEVARQVLHEMGANAVAVHSDPVQASMFQRRVFEEHHQREIELATESWVSDRSIDNAVYAWAHAGDSDRFIHWSDLEKWAVRIRTGITIMCRPHKGLIQSDGVRDTNWEAIQRIDRDVSTLMDALSIPYLPVSSVEFSDRVRAVSYLLDPLVDGVGPKRENPAVQSNRGILC